MDALRACYTTKMRFFRDDPTKLTTVRWYFVKDDTPHVPYANPFISRTWDIIDNLEEPPLGELYKERVYDKGKQTLCFGKLKLCGTQEQWEKGALTTDTIPPYQPGSKVPTCCGKIQDCDAFALLKCCDDCGCGCC